MRRPQRPPLFMLPLLALAAACDEGTAPVAPSDLTFTVPPVSMAEGSSLYPSPVVVVRDEEGETLLDWGEEVTLTLEGGNGMLEGITRRAPVAGTAVFDSLRISATGTGYRLIARSGSLEAVSESFDVHPVFRAVSVVAGWRHACALQSDGAAYCWGGNDRGQLGTGDLEHRAVATPVATEVRFDTLVAHGSFTCGLAEGSVYCWGANHRGQLGDGTREDRTLPQRVPLPGSAMAVDAGNWHACAVLADGTAWCWGENGGGALGIGAVDSLRVSPVRVVGDHDWAAIDLGYQHSCGLTTAGRAWCWGPNAYGENGTGRLDPDSIPAAVAGGHTFASLVAGGAHCHGATCGVTPDGTALCWGRVYQEPFDLYDRLRFEPAPFRDDPGLVDPVVAAYGLCGFTADREPYCMGDWFELRDPFPFTDRLNPLFPELDIVAMSFGWTHNCVITAGSETRCWGDNEHGQLGSGTPSPGWRWPRKVWAGPDG